MYHCELRFQIYQQTNSGSLGCARASVATVASPDTCLDLSHRFMYKSPPVARWRLTGGLVSPSSVNVSLHCCWGSVEENNTEGKHFSA